MIPKLWGVLGLVLGGFLGVFVFFFPELFLSCSTLRQTHCAGIPGLQESLLPEEATPPRQRHTGRAQLRSRNDLLQSPSISTERGRPHLRARLFPCTAKTHGLQIMVTNVSLPDDASRLPGTSVSAALP